MRLKLCFLAVAALLSIAAQAFAHHSFSAEYDEKKVMTVKGVVTRLEWTNPHVRFYVDVKDEKGVVTNWDLELMSVNTLTRAGWDRHTLKAGDEVNVTFYLAKDGSRRGNARGSVQLADGRKVFAGDAVTGATAPNR
jgi:hypothetical protein